VTCPQRGFLCGSGPVAHLGSLSIGPFLVSSPMLTVRPPRTDPPHIGTPPNPFPPDIHLACLHVAYRVAVFHCHCPICSFYELELMFPVYCNPSIRSSYLNIFFFPARPIDELVGTIQRPSHGPPPLFPKNLLPWSI